MRCRPRYLSICVTVSARSTGGREGQEAEGTRALCIRGEPYSIVSATPTLVMQRKRAGATPSMSDATSCATHEEEEEADAEAEEWRPPTTTKRMGSSGCSTVWS